MAAPSKTMKAYIENDAENDAVVAEIPLPKLEDNEILVKVEYVALNPTDWKHIAAVSTKGAIAGCDYAGTVVEVPASVSRKPDHIKVGARVAGWVHGGLYTDRGSFGQYLKVPANLTFPIPDNMKSEEACTIGVSFFTAFQALKIFLDLPWPPAREKGWFFVYGGSSAVGLFAIQIAKLMGFKVVTTCSPRNFDLVKSYGSDEVFDYKDPGAISKIKKVTGGGVHRGLDSISLPDSFGFSVACFAEGKGQLSVMNMPDDDAGRPDVEMIMTTVYTLWGREFEFGPRGAGTDVFTTTHKFPPNPGHLKVHEEVFALLPEYFELGLRPLPVEVRGGFSDIPKGLEELREGKVSGKRYVYTVE